MPEVWFLPQRRATLEAPSRRLLGPFVLLLCSTCASYDFKHCNILYSLGPGTVPEGQNNT